ncbi:hypothetical protein ACFOLC_15945 [Lysobacter cavernae]|uniref:Uncharacterized protein n=1 Tax=Lysobacter cavernae TaxID=1685901 RepID=A0ABV7RUW6_9GAMM
MFAEWLEGAGPEDLKAITQHGNIPFGIAGRMAKHALGANVGEGYEPRVIARKVWLHSFHSRNVLWPSQIVDGEAAIGGHYAERKAAL